VRHDRGLLPVIHLDDAVGATVAALSHGPTGSVYDIVDDRPVSMTEMVAAIADRLGAPRPLSVPSWLPRLLTPYLARLTSVRLTLSNAKAREELGWRPAYASIHDGLAATLSNAA
jgi:nucleoside-diphosphate-sugar epimerase